ncbi:MAG: FAD-binding protein [Rhodospirillaceae bacterium]|nr:FAD-binding protein [Rhodospirillaceae bacterium]
MLTMPEPDRGVLDRRAEIVAALRAIVPGEGVIDDETGRRPYECDGLTAYRQLPMVVVLPETVEQVSAVLRYCHAEGIRVVPRGAGTSLSGGALPLEDGVLLGLGKFSRILDIDYANRCAVVQPGVTNLAITQAVQQDGFLCEPFYGSCRSRPVAGWSSLNRRISVSMRSVPPPVRTPRNGQAVA